MRTSLHVPELWDDHVMRGGRSKERLGVSPAGGSPLQ
jgi:hypothetical protein